MLATFGHVRDLPTKDNAVKIAHKPKPSVAFRWNRASHFKRILEQVHDTMEHGRNANWKVVLATDPDREGEAIAWHLASLLEVCR